MTHPLLSSDEKLIRTAYVSDAASPPTLSVLENILETSRANNRERNISGTLVFSHNKFFQILEGVPTQVRALLDSIEADTRHKNVTILLVEKIESRAFAEWSMGYIAEDKGVSELPGVSSIDDIVQKLKDDPRYIDSLIKDCRNILLI